MSRNVGFILVLTLLLSACNNSNKFVSALEPSAQSLSANCKTSSVGELAINSKASVQVGENTNFSLNQNPSCLNIESISWKSLGQVVGYGDEANVSFSKPGVYAVNAVVTQAKDEVVVQITERTAAVGDNAMIVGPQVGVIDQNYTFSLAVPASMSLDSVIWNFGNGGSDINSLMPVQTSYFEQGRYTIQVRYLDSSGTEKRLTQQIQILPFQDGPMCAFDLIDIVGPIEVVKGEAANYSVNIPSCVTSIQGVSFDFGDGTPVLNQQSAQHSFDSTGVFTITVQLFTGSTLTPFITLNREVTVVPAPVVADPTPVVPDPVLDPVLDPVPVVPQPTPVVPDPVPVVPQPTPVVPQPTPVVPVPVITPVIQPPVNLCSSVGLVRSIPGELVSQLVACGTDGTKTQYLRNVVVERCQSFGEGRGLDWIQISSSQELVSETECQGQSCVGFGPNGTVKTSQLTGEIKVPLTCQFGEEGFFDIFNQVADMTCSNGQIISSATRQGEIKTKGNCPSYSYVASESFSTCSADCGGTQQQIFVCRDNNGIQVSGEHCQGLAPAVGRLCDGNPEAVKKSESSQVTEEAGNCSTCPKNQIGIIINRRDVTTTQNFACVDHQIQLTSTVSTNGAWVTESYCKDFVAHRCSQDSLTNAMAAGRKAWMIKCEDQVPVIKEYLTEMAKINIKKSPAKNISLSRYLYPTFVDRITGKPWIAPVSVNASCVVPATAYVAAVCVSSCATPEQEILTQLEGQGIKNVSFIEALSKNLPYVATLSNQGSMSSQKVDKSRVDQWVTELFDTEHQMLLFTMKSGGSLSLTTNHPLLTIEGSMKLAENFQVGEYLVKLGGKADQIIDIQQSTYYGKVYNLFVKSDVPQKNIVITNGYLNGTAYFQNQGSQDMNRKLFRNDLTRGVFSN